MARLLMGLAVGLLVATLIPVAAVGLGLIEMGARGSGNFFEVALGDRAMHRWLSKTAEDVGEMPADADIDLALDHYAYACANCHGGPGIEAMHFSQTLHPRPESLQEDASALSDQELFVVIRDGIRMSAMPAYQGLLDERELWSMVLLVRQLDQLDDVRLDRMRQIAAAGRPPWPVDQDDPIAQLQAEE